MADDPNLDDAGEISRRDLVKLSVATALAATALSSGAEAAPSVVETDVEIKTADGTCDAAFIHPAKGKHPGVIIWSDIFGLRPTLREMGKRLAAEGYSVLIPNPFYRLGTAPSLDLVPAKMNFSNTEDRAKLMKGAGSIGAPEAAEKDSAAFIEFLDAQKSVDTKKKIGTQGYCMGGPLVFRTTSAHPERIGAGATFHGGGLVTNQPSSPHLLIPKMKAQLYIAIAASDDAQQPDAKDKLREAFDAAKVPAEIHVFPTNHGWTMADMPERDGKPIYDKAEAEKAWAKLLALYKSSLA